MLFRNIGNEMIYAGMRSALLGHEGNDQIVGAPDDDAVYVGESRDTVVGEAGNDIILADGRIPAAAWGGRTNDAKTGDARWLSLDATLARIGTTVSNSTGMSQVINDTLSGLIDPLANVDFSGLLTIKREDIAQDAPHNDVPRSKRTYAAAGCTNGLRCVDDLLNLFAQNDQQARLAA